MKSPILKPDPFNIQTLDDLKAEASRLGFNLSLSSNFDLLKEPLSVGGVIAPNRLCVQPMEGCDADNAGAPGELTLRRYLRYAEGGFGMIWLEATAVMGQGRSNPHQLWLNRRNLDGFKALVDEIRECAQKRWGHELVLLVQLSHAGRYSRPEGIPAPVVAVHNLEQDTDMGIAYDYPVVSDEYLQRLQQKYIESAGLAMEAGFDGVDIKGCHNDLIAELLGADERAGAYGGLLKNRSRFHRDVIGELKSAHSGLFAASRIPLYYCGGGRLDEVPELARMLVDSGAELISVSSVPDPIMDSLVDKPHPFEKFWRMTRAASDVQQAIPDTPLLVGGLSWFRQFMPQVAAGLLANGSASLIGIGRSALSYPSLAADLLHDGKLDPDKCCIKCDGCIQLLKDGGHAGCVVMDSAIYAEEYLRCRHYAPDNLREEAKRCRGCEPAPCRTGCPSRIDVPSFLKAFAEDKLEAAYDILRESNTLPGMCANLCPVGLLCEGACVAGTLDGRPIPIHDIQFAVYWNALQRGWTGLHLPEVDTGKSVAVVGAGPAGVSCAVTLLERGHHVVLFERSRRLGGTPELAIRSSRFTGAHDEVEAILKPALFKARLMIKYGVELGRDVALDELTREHDAVFLAAGVWGEKSLGSAEGVVSGLDFLKKVKTNAIKAVPARVILLAGGDSAMDCAKVAFELGASELIIVYAGALSDMHWHMADSWFRTEGVHFMTMTRPLGYCLEADGNVSGVKVLRLIGETADGAPLSEDILAASLIIEAMGLGIESSLTAALQGCSYTEEGLVKTSAEDSFACDHSGLFAGGGMINGGDSVAQCVAEGMRAGCEIDDFLG